MYTVATSSPLLTLDVVYQVFLSAVSFCTLQGTLPYMASPFTTSHAPICDSLSSKMGRMRPSAVGPAFSRRFLLETRGRKSKDGYNHTPSMQAQTCPLHATEDTSCLSRWVVLQKENKSSWVGQRGVAYGICQQGGYFATCHATHRPVISPRGHLYSVA